MAKKNSTKTATKEALSASEPRLQAFRGWQGINIEEAPKGWNYSSDGSGDVVYQNNPVGQTDLPANYLMVQNNVVTTTTGSLESRVDEHVLKTCPSGSFTGTTYLKNDVLYAVCDSGASIWYTYINRDVSSANHGWVKLNVIPSVGIWTDIYSYCVDGKDTLILLCGGTGMDSATTSSEQSTRSKSVMYSGLLNADGTPNGVPTSTAYEPEPTKALTITDTGLVSTDSNGSIARDYWIAQHDKDVKLFNQKSMVVHVSAENAKEMGDSYKAAQNITGDLEDANVYYKKTYKRSTPNDDYGDPTVASHKYDNATHYPTSHTGCTVSAAGTMSVEGVKFIAEGDKAYFMSLANLTADKYLGKVSGNILTDVEDMLTAILSYPEIYNLTPTFYFTERLDVSESSWEKTTDYKEGTYKKDGKDAKDSKQTKIVKKVLTSPVFHYYRSDPTRTGNPANDYWFTDSYGHAFAITYHYDAVHPIHHRHKDNTYIKLGCGNFHIYVLTPEDTATGGDPSSYDAYNADNILGDYAFYYCYINKHGSTMLNTQHPAYRSLSLLPESFTSDRHINLTIPATTNSEILGAAVYYVGNALSTPIFCKYVPRAKFDQPVPYMGNLENTDEWYINALAVPNYNTTRGPYATRVTCIDSRLYFWGNKDKPYRMYMGGTSRFELYYGSSYGGGWLDIDPGTGNTIHNILKFKTQGGSNIVTMLCGNANTTKVKRFNLIENAMSTTSELETTSWQCEEVSNVVGATNDYGSGAWSDGLYVLNRYGLMVTTQQMEYSNQLDSRPISDAIKPIFTDKYSSQLLNSSSSMICIDDVVYFCLGSQAENLIFCYDIGMKAWYTYTSLYSPLRLFDIDYEGYIEGMGIVSAQHISLIPTAGDADDNLVPVKIVTGELTQRQPTSSYTHVAQLEYRFDYLKTDSNGLTIVVEGVDIYGRRVKVTKKLISETMSYDYIDWMRLDYKLENYHVTFSGNAIFRLTHFLGRVYVTSNKINEQWGFNSLSEYYRRGDSTTRGTDHHYITSYNNFKEWVLA